MIINIQIVVTIDSLVKASVGDPEGTRSDIYVCVHMKIVGTNGQNKALQPGMVSQWDIRIISTVTQNNLTRDFYVHRCNLLHEELHRSVMLDWYDALKSKKLRPTCLQR